MLALHASLDSLQQEIRPNVLLVLLEHSLWLKLLRVLTVQLDVPPVLMVQGQLAKLALLALDSAQTHAHNAHQVLHHQESMLSVSHALMASSL